MTKQYYNLLTEIGKAKLTNATLMGGTLKLTKIKVGDGGADEGKETFPNESATDLVRTRWSGNLSNLSVDPYNKNWVIAEAVIPVDVGGFYVTEFGLYDEQDDLICIGKYPSTYKPLIPQGNGTANSLYLKIILQIANASNIDLKVDLSIAMASREYVDDTFVPKSGGTFNGDIGVTGEIHAGVNHDKRVYHEGHKPTKVDVGLGNLPNAKSDAISDNSSDKLATTKAVKKVYDRISQHTAGSDPHPQYVMPTGIIINYAGVTPPEGWLICDGSEISRTTFSKLWKFALNSGNLAASEDSKELGQFGPGNGTTTLTLPNTQGVFIRGWDKKATMDSSRAFGSFQNHAFQKHGHKIQIRNGNTGYGIQISGQREVVGTSKGKRELKDQIINDFAGAVINVKGSDFEVPNISNETRPKNIAYHYIIKC